MNEPSPEALATYSFWVLVSVIQGLHPAAACGAAFGCFFLLAFPDPDRRPIVRKVCLLMFSWGVGYSLGTLTAGSASWSGAAMFVAVSGSALAATVFGVINIMIRNDGPLPKWLATILDRLPFLKPRNPNDPQ